MSHSWFNQLIPALAGGGIRPLAVDQSGVISVMVSALGGERAGTGCSAPHAGAILSPGAWCDCESVRRQRSGGVKAQEQGARHQPAPPLYNKLRINNNRAPACDICFVGVVRSNRFSACDLD